MLIEIFLASADELGQVFVHELENYLTNELIFVNAMIDVKNSLLIAKLLRDARVVQSFKNTDFSNSGAGDTLIIGIEPGHFEGHNLVGVYVASFIYCSVCSLADLHDLLVGLHFGVHELVINCYILNYLVYIMHNKNNCATELLFIILLSVMSWNNSDIIRRPV